MGVIQYRTNDALDINLPAGDQKLSVNGSDWLWAVTAVYLFIFLAVCSLTFVARNGEKIFHYIYSIALLVGAVTYFAQASDLAYSVIKTTDQLGNGLTRQIFFARYINWVVSFPSVILTLGLLSGVSWATIIYNIFLAWFWILSYISSAYTTTTYKWGFFAFGTIAWILLAANTTAHSFKSASRVGVARDYTILTCWTNLLWLLYPIAFGLSDGGNKISETSGFIFFGILDILLIPVLSLCTLFLSRNWDYNKLNIAFTQYGRVPVSSGSFPEKETAVATPAVPQGGVTV
ncbi:heat shock protein 30 [Grosmannia clavigera kw1407]|uniref:Heat shock protein 30 n=1 Tax=Grosmannia clavigera (strain kw1407 / UAMH 11150) TaxID=655863 RepID=F0XTL4_GROCL|nr:heat shock protein 30 [Grosmannia clavigera kw1407]EFW98887.1 heat shock protein 30 [Grosmannia clavigera kw1407]